MENNENIYIVLIKALTGLGKFSRKITKYEYTHIAVSLNEKLDEFITFSRRKHYSPFEAGFMHEKREHYAFGKNKNVKVKIFKIPVSKERKYEIKEYIKRIENDSEYIFNLYSMITMPIIHGFRIYKAHNCMSFVSKIIELSETVKLDKKYYKYNIKDIDNLLEKFFIEESYLNKENEDDEYMNKKCYINNIKKFFILNGKLIYRILFKRNDEK